MARKSLGGIQTDLACRVLRGEDGEPIPGLYAVGEAAGFGGGGMHGKRSLEGTFLGGCVFTGRLAAAAVAGAELPLSTLGASPCRAMATQASRSTDPTRPARSATPSAAERT